MRWTRLSSNTPRRVHVLLNERECCVGWVLHNPSLGLAQVYLPPGRKGPVNAHRDGVLLGVFPSLSQAREALKALTQPA